MHAYDHKKKKKCQATSFHACFLATVFPGWYVFSSVVPTRNVTGSPNATCAQNFGASKPAFKLQTMYTSLPERFDIWHIGIFPFGFLVLCAVLTWKMHSHVQSVPKGFAFKLFSRAP